MAAAAYSIDCIAGYLQIKARHLLSVMLVVLRCSQQQASVVTL